MNVLVGNRTGASIVNASHNTFIGSYSGELTKTGNWNTFIGNNSGFGNITGQDNTYIGSDAGKNGTDGVGNVAIGISAGEQNTGGANVFIGGWSGTENKGDGNIFIGYESGRTMEGSNMLLIDNGDFTLDKSLISGQFDEDKIRMNGFVGINTKPDSAYSIKTAGDIHANDVMTASDVRYKTDIHPISEAIDLVMAMEGVNYKWDLKKYPLKGFEEGRQYGFIAQDLERIIPELVATGNDGYKSENQHHPCGSN